MSAVTIAPDLLSMFLMICAGTLTASALLAIAVTVSTWLVFWTADAQHLRRFPHRQHRN